MPIERPAVTGYTTAASHTEAPWNVEEHGVLRVEDKYGVAIARMGEGHPQECEANARLISQAPNLLEALREWIEEPITCSNTRNPAPYPDCDCWACERTRKAIRIVTAATGASQP